MENSPPGPKLKLLGLIILTIAAVLLWLSIRLGQKPTIRERSKDTANDSTLDEPTINTAIPSARSDREYEIVTLLPKDAIPAIDSPKFYQASDADREYAAEELVLGVLINGESRAYSTQLLDHHEVVNDTIGGQKIAVTW